MNGKEVEMKATADEEMDEQTSVANYRGWQAMPYVIGNETCEKLGTIGTSSNLLVYLTEVFHMESVKAATLLNVFHGTTNLAPIFGAVLADTYFGRYATLGFASIASLIGMLFLTLIAAISKLHPPKCSDNQACIGPTTGQFTVLLSAFAFLVIGAGGIRPCNLAFGADQFNPNTESGRKGINSFFNWYYFTFTFAMMLSSTLVIYVQSNVNWAIGLAIPTIIMLFSCAFFFLGSRIYIKVKPQGSPLVSVVQVLVAAFRKRRLEHPDDGQLSLFNPPSSNNSNTRLQHTDQFRFLEKASIQSSDDQIKEDGLPADPWRLCSLQQVEEVKCIARIIPVWSACILYSVGVSQQSTYGVLQALQSDRHLGKTSFEIPAGSFTVFNMLSLTIWLPFYDRILVPRLRRITGREEGISMLRRIGIGLIVAIVATIVSAIVEERRRGLALLHYSSGKAVSPMSALWLVPQLMLFGISEAFGYIGQVEFYYKQFPENMKSVAGSTFFLNSACSSYLSGFLVTIVHQTTGKNGRGNWLADDLNKGRLDYFYYFLAIVSVVNFMYFVVCARWYRYKGIDIVSEISLGEKENSKAPPV